MTAARLDRFLGAWLSCDLDELADHLTADVVYSPLAGVAARGRSEVLRRFARELAADPGSERRFDAPVVSGSLGTCRWRLVGRDADGEPFDVAGIDVYEFRAGLICSKSQYKKGVRPDTSPPPRSLGR